MQVARPPDTHVVWPDEQLSVHVSEHMAFGASPEHDQNSSTRPTQSPDFSKKVFILKTAG